MPEYRYRFSIVTGKSTVHMPGCSAAHIHKPQRKDPNSGTHKTGDTIWTIEAPTAKAAAAALDQEFKEEERGFPKVKVCDCAKGSGET
jgi:hypothetical protein